MFQFKGNINGEVLSQAINLPSVIKNHRIVNISGLSADVNIYLVDGAQEVAISPYPKTLSATEMYSDSEKILVDIGAQIKLVTTNSCDYVFNLENIYPPDVNV